jgi:hypothetical protein
MRNLAARIPPDVRADLAAAADTLERYGPAVIQALETLERATTKAWLASMVPASLDPAELPDGTDEEWSRLEDVTGIRRGYAIAKANDTVDAEEVVL